MASVRDVEGVADGKPPPGRRMTEEEFVAWCDENTKAEWIDGEVIVVSPASAKHVRLARFLLHILDALVTERDLGEVLGTELQVRLGPQRRRRVPDVLFVAKGRLAIIRSHHVEGAPDLIIEIVSPDSEARDWRDKHLEYEAAGVRDYWVIDQQSQVVEADALGTDGRYMRIPEQDGTLSSSVLPGFRLELAWLWQDPLPNTRAILKELGVL
jgi:Uma2 family endonuclease